MANENFAKTTDTPFILINPRNLVLPNFDSRGAEGPLTEDFLNSIKAGVLVPVLVAPLNEKDAEGHPKFMVIAGRRRVRAAIQASLPEIPCHVKAMTKQEALIAAGKENMHRLALNAWDIAIYFRDLKDSGLSQTEIKDYMGRSDAFVSQHLSIFDLDSRVQTLVRSGKFEPGTISKVRELKNIKDGDTQYDCALKVIDKDKPWRAEDIRRYAMELKAKDEARAEAVKLAKASAAPTAPAPTPSAVTAQAPATPTSVKAATPAPNTAPVKVEVKQATTPASAAPKPDIKVEVKPQEAQKPAPVSPPASASPYPLDKVFLIDAKTMKALLDSQAKKLKTLRTVDPVDPLKVAFNKGLLEGYERAAGFLQALPRNVEELAKLEQDPL